MPSQFNPHLEVLPPAQREMWPLLVSAAELGFVLYGGTAVALHFGHRTSIDFDFFKAEPLDKDKIATAFSFMRQARMVQEDKDTVVVDVTMPMGHVKVSFFGGLALGHLNDPLLTTDKVLLVASPEDLLATKLKAILDRAEAKDYRDIAAILSAGTSLEKALGAFTAMFKRDAALPLRALGYFKDGDLASLPKTDQDLLRTARDGVLTVPEVDLQNGVLPASA